MASMTKEQAEALMEALADVEHERWSNWMAHLFRRCTVMPNGDMVIIAADVKRWTRQINTPYADLTEDEKESDRREVRKTLRVLESFQ